LVVGNVPAVLAIAGRVVVILTADVSAADSTTLSYVAFIVGRAATLGSIIGLAGAAVFWVVARAPDPVSPS
jgi:type III secretory pathway component EscT